MLLSHCLRGKPLFCGKQIINNVLRGCSTKLQRIVAQNDGNNANNANNSNKQDLFKSIVFPGYTMIYVSPNIYIMARVNVAKTIATFVSSVGSVVSYALVVYEILPHVAGVQTILMFLLATMWFHLIGLMCNNFVGAIYVDENGENAIISYINYWGLRVNLLVNSILIVPLDEVSPNIMKKMYRKLYTIEKSGKRRVLKIHLEHKDAAGSVIDEEKLKTIIGTWK